jgi:hypothetical protein
MIAACRSLPTAARIAKIDPISCLLWRIVAELPLREG